MVFYRKYRSQTLDELIGQENIKQSLKSAILSGALSHAYLLCGPRGTGKTSTARILAKIVNCETRGEKEYNPCNSCKNCLSITDGSNLDVVEMDAASNRGIEDIRVLRENIKLTPTSSKKKVYIIDEVHMLTGDAFNALLKTLEEPPSHVMFILATTEVQKIPQTILSRVQRLDFKMGTAENLTEALKKVVLAEKLEVDSDALLLIVSKASGSFRDAIKLLDQLSSLPKIDKKAVEDGLGLGAFENTSSLMEDIINKNPTGALGKVISSIESGINIREFTLSLLEILRQLLLIKNGLGEKLVKPESGENKFKFLEELAGRVETERLVVFIDLFQKSLEQSKYTTIPSLPLEVAVVEGCIEKIQNQGRGESPEISERSKILDKSENQMDQNTKISGPSDTLDIKPSDISGHSEDTKANFSEITQDDIQKIQEKWGYVLETVRQYNFSLEALLRSAKIIECKDHNVTVEVPYSFHQRILEAPKSREPLEAILSDILGRSVRVSTVLRKKPVTLEELANVEVAADDEIVRLASEIFSSDTVN